MNKIKIAKIAVRLVVGSGTMTISNSIIRNNVEPTNLFQQISVGLASVVLGSMASEATREHTDARIDELVEVWQKNTSEEEPVPA